jgi:hypothetical protein
LAGGCSEISGTANTSLSLSQLQCLSLTRPCCLAAVGTAMEAAAGTFSSPIAPPYNAPRFPCRPAITSKRSASRDGTCSCSSHLSSCFQETQDGWIDRSFSVHHPVVGRTVEVELGEEIRSGVARHILRQRRTRRRRRGGRRRASRGRCW